MPLLDIQQRGQQIGRIRIGQQVAVIRDGRDTGKTRPARLDTFRFTTASRTTADAIAALYGGTVRDWETQFEVITGQSEIGVTVPPRDAVITQWYEMWTAGGCQRRCDSQREQVSGGQCLCPHAADPSDAKAVAVQALERARLSKLNPPQACSMVTRINVMIPDLPGLGVFRLDSGSYYAATEIGDSARLMQMARDRGVMIPAMLRIEQRSRVAGGQTKRFPVPVLEVLVTFRDLTTGVIEAGGMAAQLPPAPGAPRAITSGQPVTPPAAVPAQAARPARQAPPPEVPRGARPPAQQGARTAQQIADEALQSTTSEDVAVLISEAKGRGLGDHQVRTDDGDDEAWEDLKSLLVGVHNRLPAAGGEPS